MEYIDLQRALLERGVYPKCPACGNDRYLTGIDETNRLVVLPTEGGGTTGVGVYPMTCLNCGHIQLFAAQVLEK